MKKIQKLSFPKAPKAIKVKTNVSAGDGLLVPCVRVVVPCIRIVQPCVRGR